MEMCLALRERKTVNKVKRRKTKEAGSNVIKKEAVRDEGAPMYFYPNAFSTCVYVCRLLRRSYTCLAYMYNSHCAAAASADI